MIPRTIFSRVFGWKFKRQNAAQCLLSQEEEEERPHIANFFTYRTK